MAVNTSRRSAIYPVGVLRGTDAISQSSEQKWNTWARDERFMESAMRPVRGRDVSTT
jgi:hypothetical protein